MAQKSAIVVDSRRYLIVLISSFFSYTIVRLWPPNSAVISLSAAELYSQGAYGIEASAHRAPLIRGANTIAVLASGVDRPYPAGHTDLIDHIARDGLLLSEEPPSLALTRQRFIDRSRILVALSAQYQDR